MFSIFLVRAFVCVVCALHIKLPVISKYRMGVCDDTTWRGRRDYPKKVLVQL